VFEQNIDDITGVVYAKDLMRAVQEDRDDEVVRALARPAQFVPESKRVAELMREMQLGKYHMAIVVDEYGGTAGLATLEDVIEELVGEIEDEFDISQPKIVQEGDTYRVGGLYPMHELRDKLGLSDEDIGDVDTVSGYVVKQLARWPHVGDVVKLGDYDLKVLSLSQKRVGQVQITRTTAQPASEEAQPPAR